jgi:hypothetical protein
MINLFLNRKVVSDWHLRQSIELKKLALSKNSPTALIYSSLEARNTIERFIFEMSVLSTGGNFTDEQIEMAQQQHGIYKLLEDTMINYRKFIEFQNMCFIAARIPINFIIPDIRMLKRFYTSLSKYCHCQLDPAITIDNISGDWFIKGYALIDETCDYLCKLMSSIRGSMERNTMPPEVRELCDGYIQDTINRETVETRLTLMQPVLEQRLRYKR